MIPFNSDKQSRSKEEVNSDNAATGVTDDTSFAHGSFANETIEDSSGGDGTGFATINASGKPWLFGSFCYYPDDSDADADDHRNECSDSRPRDSCHGCGDCVGKYWVRFVIGVFSWPF